MLTRSVLFRSTLSTLSVLTLAATATTAGAEIILDDDFSSGSNPGYTVTPPGGPNSVTVTTDPAPAGLPGKVLLLSTTQNNRTAVRSFDSAVTLTNVGDFIELDLDYRLDAPLDDTFGFTSSLLGSGGVEAGINFNPAAQSNGGTYFADGSNNSGRFNTIDSGTAVNSLLLRITKEDATTVRLTSSFNGSPRVESNTILIGTQITAPLTFDGLELGWTSGNQGDVYFDNVRVTSNVPEPASLALALLGGVMCLTRRR